jgi:hypothetical protein
MKKLLLNPAAMFFVSLVLVCAVLLIFPVRLFDGEISYNVGGKLFIEQTKLQLTQLTDFGPGGDEELKRVSLYTIHKYLTAKGYLMLFLLAVGLPLLIAYRSRIAKREAQKNSQN